MHFSSCFPTKNNIGSSMIDFKEFYKALFDKKETENLIKVGEKQIRQFVRFVEEYGEDQVFDFMVDVIMEKESLSKRSASSIASADYNALVRLCQGDYDFHYGRSSAESEAKALRRKELFRE